MFALFGVLTMAMFSSCKDDTTEDLAPLLTITTAGLGANNTAVEGTTYTIEVIGAENPTSGKQLKTLEIQTPGPDTTITINASSYNETFTRFAPLDGVSETYTLILTDKDDVTATNTLTVTGTSGGVVSTPFGTEVLGAFFHVGGSLQGAFDLVAETPIALAGVEANKDMKNLDTGGSPFTGSFTTGTGNGTKYVRANSFDYATGSVEDAIAAYDAGNAGGTMLNPFSGNVFIAKLRGGTDGYAVIQITTIDPTDNTCTCGNPGKMSFNFKKQ
jgi:hypothetical protein